MRRFFWTNTQGKGADSALLIFRVGLAAMMLTHGIPKIDKLFGEDPVMFASVFGFTPVTSLALAIFVEVGCSVLLIFGLSTRFATLMLAATMGVAAFQVMAGQPFGARELPILYLLGFVTIFILGAGKWSVDYYLGKRPVITKVLPDLDLA
ncbi:MAG: DoxX family protein [Ferruginibacter sp.]|nr:DoxX family protein [Ferruginibacter sp.]